MCILYNGVRFAIEGLCIAICACLWYNDNTEKTLTEKTMCGRYYVEMSDDELREITEKAKHKLQSEYRELTLKSNGEIFPTDTVAVLVGEGDFSPMIWGFTFAGKKLLINARFETFTEKPTFKNCRRCVIPASGYFEWKRDSNPKTKYAFYAEDSPLFLAAIYKKEADKPLPSFVILTREAKGVAADIHHRMPVIIPREEIEKWLSGDFSPRVAVTDIHCEKADQPRGQIKFYL
jgi:putative SOS response-associated peptidase YedK